MIRLLRSHKPFSLQSLFVSIILTLRVASLKRRIPLEFYAHSVEGKSPEEWHLLEEHLLNVAELAKKFGDEFGSGDWAYLAGLWHDLGKNSEGLLS